MQRAGAIDYGSSTIRNTDKARGRSNEPLPPDAMQFSCRLTAWQMLAVALTVLMIPIYAFGGVLLSAYCGYLVYAACWSYRLWQLNDPKH